MEQTRWNLLKSITALAGGAIGANAVLVGNPICFGLACGGAEGVTKGLTILRKEFELAMALTVRGSIAAIDASVIWK